MKSAFCNHSKFHPLLLEAVEIIKNRINSLSDLKTLSLDPKLYEIYTHINDEELFIINEFYKAKGFRKLHLEIAKLGNSLQILHCVFFPDPCYDLPIFGVDLVINSNNISAAIIDLSPVGEHTNDVIRTRMKSIYVPEFKEIRKLPSWGYIFSPYVCFIRPIDPFEEKLFLKLIDDYLSILISLLNFEIVDDLNSSNTISRFKYQKRYCLNQKRNDKTRSILAKFFGSSWADEYIEEILFDC